MSLLRNYKLDSRSYLEGEDLKIKKETKSPFLKRPFDVLLSSIGLMLSLPLWVLIGIAIWLEDRGPIFYSQTRMGKNGRQFRLIKFRSMIKNAEQQTGAVWANKDDYRITKIGKFLRRTALDELPQLLNIFKGDMSFVGPRAERPEIVKEILKEIHEFNDRLAVLPGLTGIAQVYGNYNTPPRHKLRYDLLYIRNQSFILDLKLILISFWITFTFKWSEREKRVERLIGQIMIEAGVISEEELNNALQHQKVWGGKIGENLIQLGYITRPELRHFLDLQVVQNGKGSWIVKNNNHNSSSKLLGQIMLELGVITEEQLKDSLQSQKVWGGKIGESLVRKGYISESELKYFLKKQLSLNEMRRTN